MKAPGTRPKTRLDAEGGIPAHSSSKRTEVGVIPDDWDVLPLRSLVRCFSGGTPRMSDKRFWGGEIPWVTSKDMKVLRLSDAIDHVKALAIGRGTRLVDPGAILIVVRGMSLLHSLPVALVEQPVAFNQDLKALVPQSDVNPEFILGWLQVAQAPILLLTSEATHGTKRLPTGDLLATKIPVPSFDEQRSIAEALADVDGLIGALEKLIVKKQAIKQATMQQLLTGKIRLPGFAGKWETKRLADLGPFSKGRGIRRDQVSDEGVPCVRYGELYTRYHDYVMAPISRVSTAVARTALPITNGDLLFAGSGETAEEIGRCAAYLGEGPAYAGGDTVVLSPRGQNSMYLGHLMNQRPVAVQKARFGQGDAVVHISARNLAQVEISLPFVEEQAAIAAVLSDIDSEIAVLERRQDKTREIKQGMMQQLLTGQVRLVVRPQARAAQAQAESKEMKAHSWAFNEAVLISTLAKHFGSEQFPLGRKRYTKLCYLLHRHAEKQAEGYLKKAAGPYNPRTKYGGPERIAVENGYVREHASGPYRGFVAANNIAQAEGYFGKWYGADCIQWLEQFRFKKNDDLEVLATVDMAAEELRAAGTRVNVDSVKDVIRGHPEWQAKLDRPVFSDANIGKAIETSRTLFG